jgi:hypothetical protein
MLYFSDSTLVSHVTGYESDKTFMGLSRTKSEGTYHEVSKHSGIKDCFGSEMATLPSTQTETLDSRNEETCPGTVQDARRLDDMADQGSSYIASCCTIPVCGLALPSIKIGRLANG